MRLVWSKSSLPLSIVIRAITKEDCSHFAFVFDSPAGGMAFQSNLLGCGPEFFTSFKNKVTIVHEMDLPVSEDIEDLIWSLVVDKYDGKPYDFMGAIYLGWRILLKRLFNKPLPDKNLWASSGSYFCDELYSCLSPIEGLPKINVTDAMKTPHDVWLALQDWGKK